MFHVSILKKYITNPDHVIQFFGLDIRGDFLYEKQLVKIMDLKKQALRRWIIPYCKVYWSNHFERGATWELESAMRERYSHLFY